LEVSSKTDRLKDGFKLIQSEMFGIGGTFFFVLQILVVPLDRAFRPPCIFLGFSPDHPPPVCMTDNYNSSIKYTATCLGNTTHGSETGPHLHAASIFPPPAPPTSRPDD